MIGLSILELKELLAICQTLQIHAGEMTRYSDTDYWRSQYERARKMAERLHTITEKPEEDDDSMIHINDMVRYHREVLPCLIFGDEDANT